MYSMRFETGGVVDDVDRLTVGDVERDRPDTDSGSV